MRKKILLMMSMILSLTIYSGWNESEYREYSLSNFINLNAKLYGSKSEMRNFPNEILIYKKKNKPMRLYIPNLFSYYYNAGSSMFALHTDVVTTGRNGIKVDVISNSDIHMQMDWSGRRYYKGNPSGENTLPITATFEIDHSLDETRSIDVYWEARIQNSGAMDTTNQRITVKIQLELKAFDLDLGQHILGSSDHIEGSTKIYVEGEVFSEVELRLEESNIELLNENHQVADTYLDLNGSDSVNINLGSGGEAVVNLNGRVTNSLQDVGTYQGEVKITAKYI